MAVRISELHDGRLLEVEATGRLSRNDYRECRPEIERQIQRHGRIRLLFQMTDFHGWNFGGLWEDLKFDAKHFGDIERLALVGEKKWEKWMATVCRPFTKAEVRYFDRSQADTARIWVAGT